MAGNPKDSAWRVTGNDRRKRKNVMLTLPPEALERLEELAAARGVSRSMLVEQLVMAAAVTGERPVP